MDFQKNGEGRKVNEICRICINRNDEFINIYSKEGLSNDLANKINLYLPIKVAKSDDLPLQCCSQCASIIVTWHDLVITSGKTDKKLRSWFLIEKPLQEQEICEDAESTDIEQLFEIEDQYQIKANTYLNSDLDCGNSSKEILSEIQDEVKDDNEEHHASLTLIDYHNSVNLETKTCILCRLSFSTKTLLKTHMRDKHKLKEKKNRRKKSEICANFSCPACSKSFTRKYDMQKHIMTKHTNQITYISPSKRSKNKKLLEKCQILTDKGNNCYQCDFCEKKFTLSHNLIRHRNTHISETSYVCHICGVKFVASNSLRRHINQLHYGIKNFSCNFCGRTFTRKLTRDEHLNIHTDNRPFVCDTCGKSFRQQSSLHIHKMFHSNVFKHVCTICRKKFKRRQDLKIHQCMHTGEKPHQCQTCNISFRLRQDLKRHIKLHVEYFGM